MKRLNLLFTLTSLNVLLVTIERFSFTTKIILQPYSFLRLHEVFQMTTIILFTVVIPFFVLREVTKNFQSLKSKKGMLLGVMFVTGVYFYSTGNGVHELGSYFFNTYCPTKTFATPLCKSAFFNDYYFGNILYFAGAFLMVIALALFERQQPDKTYKRRDLIILWVNSGIFAFTIFAYAAFDRVLVGLVYSLVTAIAVDWILLSSKQKFSYLPYTFYNALAYTIGAVASLLIRFHP